MRLVTREILSIMEDNSIPLTPAYGIREIERRRNSDMFNSSGVRSVFFFFQASKKIIYIFIKEKKKGSKEKIKKTWRDRKSNRQDVLSFINGSICPSCQNTITHAKNK